MAKSLTYNATLVERVDINPKLAIFRIRPDQQIPSEDSWFIPGQYMVIGLNNLQAAELGGVQRPMSIASPPECHEWVEFYVRYVDQPDSENPLTHLLWQINTGDRLYCRLHPAGKFTLAQTVGENDPRLKVFVAAGTGLAPFVSMLESLRRQNPQVRLEDYVVIHGASYEADLGYRAHMEMLAKQHGLHYFATVSRPQENHNWQGAKGRAEDFFREDRLLEFEQQLGLPVGGFSPRSAQVLICGLQGTIGQCIERLLARGFVPDNHRLRRTLEVPEEVPASLFYEAYDTTPPIDVKNEEWMATLRLRLKNALEKLAVE